MNQQTNQRQTNKPASSKPTNQQTTTVEGVRVTGICHRSVEDGVHVPAFAIGVTMSDSRMKEASTDRQLPSVYQGRRPGQAAGQGACNVRACVCNVLHCERICAQCVAIRCIVRGVCWMDLSVDGAHGEDLEEHDDGEGANTEMAGREATNEPTNQQTNKRLGRVSGKERLACGWLVARFGWLVGWLGRVG